MAVQLQQSNQVTSAASAPTTITPTLGVASTAGSLLILIVACTSTGSPVISTPVSWNVIQNVTISGCAVAIFYYVNNPGGITSVPVTLTTTTAGGACATLMEFFGVGTVPNVEFSGNQSGNGNNPLSFTFPRVVNIGDLSLYGVGSGVATQTILLSREWAQVGSQQNSTNAVTINASLSVFWATNSGPATPQIVGGSLSATVNWVDVAGRLTTSGGGLITFDNVGNGPGIYVPQFYQGMIGG